MLPAILEAGAGPARERERGDNTNEDGDAASRARLISGGAGSALLSIRGAPVSPVPHSRFAGTLPGDAGTEAGTRGVCPAEAGGDEQAGRGDGMGLSGIGVLENFRHSRRGGGGGEPDVAPPPPPPAPAPRHQPPPPSSPSPPRPAGAKPTTPPPRP